MKSGRAIALLPLMLLFAACSANPSTDEAAAQAAIVTPTSAGVSEAPSADQPPADPRVAPAPGTDTPPAAEPAAPPEPNHPFNYER